MCTKFVTTLLLLVGFALLSHANDCPQSDRLPKTCVCKDDLVYGKVDIALSCKSATIVEVKDALHLIDKNSKLYIELKEMNLETLPSQIFDGWNVAILIISHCELDSLAPQGQVALAGLEDKLEELNIFGSFSEEKLFTKINLSHMKRLKKLNLSYNSITEVSNDWFANGPASLTDIFLWKNRISNLGDQAFTNISNLRYLELEGNRFGEIKRSMLPRPANGLTNLQLKTNGFTSLPDDLFVDMPALEELYIADNGFVHLQEKIFKPIWSQLDIFDASNNPIECDSTMEWLFDVKKPSHLLGTCQGPLDRKGMDLDEFIDNKGQ